MTRGAPTVVRPSLSRLVLSSLSVSVLGLALHLHLFLVIHLSRGCCFVSVYVIPFWSASYHSLAHTPLSPDLNRA